MAGNSKAATLQSPFDEFPQFNSIKETESNSKTKQQCQSITVPQYNSIKVTQSNSQITLVPEY